MIKINRAILESRIEAINNAIAKMREDATPATQTTVEVAIDMLAVPELEKVKAELAELNGDCE
jgi:hypothetical protein|tara:strand:- start:1048 stop:1236 length:189 start_codon:yes stop_codon:yes gene_type:complete